MLSQNIHEFQVCCQNYLDKSKEIINKKIGLALIYGQIVLK